ETPIGSYGASVRRAQRRRPATRTISEGFDSKTIAATNESNLRRKLRPDDGEPQRTKTVASSSNERNANSCARWVLVPVLDPFYDEVVIVCDPSIDPL
ncbi:MAG: hypothetical protein ACXV5U_08735, partial [Ilumatobacteraceae bacterium]